MWKGISNIVAFLALKLQFSKLIFDVSRGDGTFLKARGEAKKGELDEQLKEYINEWRKQRAKEEEELKKLKDKQAKRKEIRSEQEKKLAQQKKEEEERLRKEEAEKKAQEAEEKRKKLEEAEKKRQEMMKAQKEKMGPAGGSKGGNKKQEGVRILFLSRQLLKTWLISRWEMLLMSEGR